MRTKKLPRSKNVIQDRPAPVSNSAAKGSRQGVQRGTKTNRETPAQSRAIRDERKMQAIERYMNRQEVSQHFRKKAAGVGMSRGGAKTNRGDNGNLRRP